MTPLVSGHVTDKHYFIKCFKSNTNQKKNAKQFLEPLINKNTSDEQKIVFMQIQTLSLRLYQLIARVIPWHLSSEPHNVMIFFFNLNSTVIIRLTNIQIL